MAFSSAQSSQYAALTGGVGLADLGQRTQIELTGADRASFLHNLCTNNVRSLSPGSGCEAFFLNVQGKILAFATIFCRTDSLVIETVGGQGESLVKHLDRYLIREKVELHDRGDEWGELLIAGRNAESFLQRQLACPTPVERLAHFDVSWRGQAISLRRVPFTGSHCFFLSGERASLGALRDALIVSGATHCDPAVVEAARIEAGTPLFGRDITEKNLPQEVARNATAISFTKGCYLGQETVARIDALGHVNKTLVGVRFADSEIPADGCELTAETGPVGIVTSAAWSPVANAPLALAYVKRGHNRIGAKLTSALGDAEVVALGRSGFPA